jgi:transcriptional regulator with XRE-family HTH domain
MISRTELRKRAGLRQADLAFVADVSIPSVSRWERGLMNLNASALERIALAISSRISEMPFFEDPKEITKLIAVGQNTALEVTCEQ